MNCDKSKSFFCFCRQILSTTLVNVFLPETLAGGCGLTILAPSEAHLNLDPIWMPVPKGCLVPTYRGKAAFQRNCLFLLLENSVIALVKKGFFPTSKQMPYAINSMFPITVAYKCPRIFRIFFIFKRYFINFVISDLLQTR